MAVLSLAFWGISILLSRVVILICISPQQCTNVPVLPYPHQYLLLLHMIMTILTGVRWNPSVDLHLFYSQGSWTLLHVFTGNLHLFHWEFCLILLPISSLRCWLFGDWVFWVLCRFWLLVPYCMRAGIDFLSHCRGCLLSQVTVSFVVQKLFSLMHVSLRCWAFLVLLSHFLYLSIPVYFLHLPGVVSKFQSIY
jgi:hypothetical protein